MSKCKAFGLKTAPLIFWALVWQWGSILVGNDILLPPPMEVVRFILTALPSLDFWQSIIFSSFKIMLGFFLSLILGGIFASLSYKHKILNAALRPLVQGMKAVPVVSFIIMLLIWCSPKWLSVVISFIMVFPIIFLNIYESFSSIPKELLEMAEVFKLDSLTRIRYIIIPHVFPFLCSACKIALGVSWKSGIAAEVIAIPAGSIGEMLYFSKIYLNTAELLGWTAVILALSFAFEHLFLKLLDYIFLNLRRG
ncbi:MAG: ABC transporter permease subunit [Oscillospiraceae bacterium]